MTNEIVCNRLIDYTNPNRGDYIYLNQTDTSNVFFNVYCNRAGFTGNTDKIYSYYIIQGDFTSTELGTVYQMFMIRDSNSGSSSVTSYPATLRADGSLMLSSGGIIANVAQEGNKFNYKMAVNLKNNSGHMQKKLWIMLIKKVFWLLMKHLSLG